MSSPTRVGPPSQNRGEQRHGARVGILTGFGEVVVVNLGSQTGLLLDLSAGGIAVQAVYTIQRQAQNVEIGFQLPFTGDRIEAVCQVAWIDEGSRAGLKFVRVGDGPRRQLEAWLSKHLEEANTAACFESGHGLSLSSGTTRVPRNEPKLGATAQAALESPLRMAPRPSSVPAWKVACLALLWFVLGIVVSQQQFWRWPLRINRGVRSLNVRVVTPSQGVATSADTAPRRIEPAAPTTRSWSATVKTPKTASPEKLPSKIKVKSAARSPAAVKLKSPTSIDLPNSRVQGSVVMRAIIDTDGNIRRLWFISGNPALADSAMEAVTKWKHQPYLLDGRAVEAETTITVNFKR